MMQYTKNDIIELINSSPSLDFMPELREGLIQQILNNTMDKETKIELIQTIQREQEAHANIAAEYEKKRADLDYEFLRDGRHLVKQAKKAVSHYNEASNQQKTQVEVSQMLNELD